MFLKKVVGMASEVSLKGLKSPDSELETGEKVVGTLPDDLKKLYVVMQDAREKTKALHARLENVPEDVKKLKLIIQEHAVVHLEENLVREAFWTCVRLEFPETVSGDVGLRKDWQVVLI